MRYSFLIFILLFALLPIMAAEQRELNGIVIDAETNQPIPGVIVKSKRTFTSTGREGKFSININENDDSISFKCVGYEPMTLPATIDLSIVPLNPKSTQLNDVIVEAPDIYAKGDTLVFNVSRYAKEQDNAIIDVIKRLPGIKVEEDGTIKYQGKPINKFYLDGNDFIGGQYGLATNNISHKDVKAVEVMENHQPVKALEGIEFPDEAGINLKLKEDAKSRWVGVANLSGGLEPLLYNASMFTMRMASKMQNMFTLKADNTGWNPAHEITEHNFYSMFSNEYSASLWPEYITADITNPPLTERRTRDNLSWLANAISAWKRGDNSMRLKFNYFADRLDYNSDLSTNYFDESIPDLLQTDKLRSHCHNLSLTLHSEINKRGYYLVDNLSVNAIRNSSRSDITGSSDLTQEIRRNNFSAVNDLKLVKRNEKKLFTLTSRNSISCNPDKLNVNFCTPAMQSISTIDARSTTETEFGKLTRFRKFYITVGLDLNYHRIDCSLTGISQLDNSGIYNSFSSNLYAVPQLDLERNGWSLSFRVPTSWLHYSINGQHDFIAISPRFNIRRQLTAKSELSANISYNLKAPQAYRFINNFVLSDYRNIFQSAIPGGYSGNCNVRLSYRYRNPLKSLFFNIEGGYSFSRAAIMSNQIFIENFIVSSSAQQTSNTQSINVKSSFSKGLSRSKMVVGCEISGSISSASSMRDYIILPYQQHIASISPFFKGSILKWFSLNYEAGYNYSNLRVGDESSVYNTFHQNLQLSFLPCDKVDITAGTEHFLTHFSEGKIANLILIDARATWRINSKFRVSLTASNLLNQKKYEYITFGTLSETEYSFRIRGRNILLGLQYRF